MTIRHDDSSQPGPEPHVKRPRQQTRQPIDRNQLLASGIGALGPVIAAAVAVMLGWVHFGGSGATAPQPTRTVVVTVQATPSLTAPSAATSAVPAAAKPDAQSLLSMKAAYGVDGYNSPDFGSGSQEVNGPQYSQTLYDTQSNDFECSNNGYTDTATYQLDHKYRQFHAVVGLADSSGTGDTVTFSFLVDGQQEGLSPTLAVGKTVTININVTGAFRLVLQDSCASAQANSDAVTAVWINPSLTP